MRREHLLRLGVRFGRRRRRRAPRHLARAARRRLASPRRRPPATPSADDDGSAPLERLAHYDAVFAFIAAHPELPDARRRLVLPAMLREELARLERLPEPERPAAFAALSERWRRHRRGDEPVRGRAARAARSARSSAATTAPSALSRRRCARAGRSRARRRGLTRRGRRAARRRPPPAPRAPLPRAPARQPDRPRPRRLRRATGTAATPATRARSTRRRASSCPACAACGSSSPRRPRACPPGVESVVRGTPEYYDVIARAGVFVNNVNFPNHLVKREGTVHVMTHHGTPLKTMGMDLKDTPIAGAKMDFDALLRRCARWDFSISSNRVLDGDLGARLPHALRVARGRLPAQRRARQRRRGRGPPDPRASSGSRRGQVAILYAPTHREHRSSYVPVLDLAAVAEGARAGVRGAGPRPLLLRCGPVAARAAPRGPRARRRVAPVGGGALPRGGRPPHRLLLDHVRLRRPGPPDRHPCPRLGGLPQPARHVLRPHGRAARARDADRGRGDRRRSARATRRARRPRAARAEFRARFCSLEDGRAAERVVRRVWLGEREEAGPRPAPVAR